MWCGLEVREGFSPVVSNSGTMTSGFETIAGLAEPPHKEFMDCKTDHHETPLASVLTAAVPPSVDLGVPNSVLKTVPPPESAPPKRIAIDPPDSSEKDSECDDTESNDSDEDVGSKERAAAKLEAMTPQKNYNTKIAYRLTKAVDDVETNGNIKSRSAELVPLTQGYNLKKKGFRSLITAAKNYHKAVIAMEESRTEFIKQLALFSEGTPLYDYIGKPLDEDIMKKLDDALEVETKEDEIKKQVQKGKVDRKQTGRKRRNSKQSKSTGNKTKDGSNEKVAKESDTTQGTQDNKSEDIDDAKTMKKEDVTTPEKEKKKSVTEIIDEWKNQKRIDSDGNENSTTTTTTDFGSLLAMQQLKTAYSKELSAKFEKQIVSYAVEWEEVVTSRVDTELKELKELQKDRRHYEEKVDLLRIKVDTAEVKGRTSPTSVLEKLERNEQKLSKAWNAHETAAGQVCVVMDEATNGGWKDLYHLVTNTIELESNRLSGETDFFNNLPTALECMKSTYKKIDPTSLEQTTIIPASE